MKQWMKKATAGSALVEVVLAITILGLVSAPICSSLLVAARINARSRDVMTAQMQVSSAVEYLMAKGIEWDEGDKRIVDPGLPGVTVVWDYGGDEKPAFCYITVTDGVVDEDDEGEEIIIINDTVTVETCVKVELLKEVPEEDGDA